MSHKIAKKIRREVKDLKVKLASELKGLINGLPLRKRIELAVKIIFKRSW